MPVEPISRRMFLGKLGKGTLAVAVFGLAACGDSADPTAASTTVPASTVPTSTVPPPTSTATTVTRPTLPDTLTYQRVNLGFVSAYVLIRNDRAAVVDTGVSGSAGDIEAALGTARLGWGAVDDVILTHHHNDHVGSVADVLNQAQAAKVYAGEADIGSISTPRPLTAVGDGDEVFGLRIIETPGHTAGHISVFDPASRILVAGDALTGADGGVAGANPQFSDDIPAADASVLKLAAFEPDTILFGHGEPVEGGAAELLGIYALSI